LTVERGARWREKRVRRGSKREVSRARMRMRIEIKRGFRVREWKTEDFL
jgi:hypothetical protein